MAKCVRKTAGRSPQLINSNHWRHSSLPRRRAGYANADFCDRTIRCLALQLSSYPLLPIDPGVVEAQPHLADRLESADSFDHRFRPLSAYRLLG